MAASVELSPAAPVREASQERPDSLYPELEWLKGEGVNATQEGVSLTDVTSIEYVRTLLTLKCLHLFFEGGEESYNTFKAAQKSDALSREAFDALHGKTHTLAAELALTPLELQRLMETALILGDMGKTQTARELFPTVTAPDHDDFEKGALEILRETPELCPTFAKLSPSEQKILVQATGLIHFGHVYHLEGGPEMFSSLKEAKVTSAILEFALFVQRCDVAGALAHRNPDHSITFTQTAYEMYEAVGKACILLLQEGKTEADAYLSFLHSRAAKVHLDPSNPKGEILTRIAAMLRLFTPEDGQLLEAAFDLLSPADAELASSQFLSGGLTPTYIPAVFINLLGNLALGETRNERLKNAITLGLPLIANALQIFRAEMDPSYRACFNDLAGQAKGETALLLPTGTIKVDLDGNVSVQLPLPEGIKG